MLIREIQSDFNLQHGAAPRSPGIHVSEILRTNALDLGVLKREDEEEIDFTLAMYRANRGDDISTLYPAAIYRVALGLAWEQWLGSQWPAINFHTLGELKRDGIIGTPDGLSFCPANDLPYISLMTAAGAAFVQSKDTGVWVPYDPYKEISILHEIKFTHKSSRSGSEQPHERLAKEWLWYAQTKAYCWMASIPSHPVLISHLHVMWVNGSYHGKGPEFRTYEFIFTTNELEANWRLITKTRDRLAPESGK